MPKILEEKCMYTAVKIRIAQKDIKEEKKNGYQVSLLNKTPIPSYNHLFSFGISNIGILYIFLKIAQYFLPYLKISGI